MLDSKAPATTIVVGVDGSPRSEDAIGFAGRLAGAIGARVALVCAYGYGPLAGKFGGAVEVHDLGTGLRHEAEAVLRRARDLLPGVVAVTTRAVAEPSPARALHDVAVESSASLVVLGSSHVGRLGRIAPGRTAERLLHGAPCAVVVVPAGAREHPVPLAPIGAAFDDSPESHVALAAAVATIPDDVDVEPVLLVGRPARELAEASSGLAMLFVGSRGYGPLRAVVLGGVGGALVRDAACPVIVTARGAAVDTATTTAAAAATR